MASSNNGSASGDGKEKESDAVKEPLNILRKQFSENGTMDRLKERFAEEIKTCDSHKKNIEKLQQILTSSGDQVSYEDAFKDLGGPAFRSSVSDVDDLDGILQKLIQEKHIALPEEEKKRLFEKWDEELHQLRRRFYPCSKGEKEIGTFI